MTEEEDVGLTFSDEDFERRYSVEDASGMAASSPPHTLQQSLCWRRQAGAATGSCGHCSAAAWPLPAAVDQRYTAFTSGLVLDQP